MTEFSDLAAHLDRASTVTIITVRASGQEVATPIWVAVVDGTPYVRSAFGAGAVWNRRARTTPTGAFTLAPGANAERDPVAALRDPRLPVGFEHLAADDPAHAAIDAAFEQKYAGSPHVRPLLTDDARALTLRVVPV